VEPAEIRGTRTHENLKLAFSRESEANRRYLFFARIADVEGFPDVAGLFRDTAEGETGHALGHLERLKSTGDPATDRPMGRTKANLESAAAGEASEGDEMYPEMAKAAREEGFPEIAEWFETLARAERQHAGRFRKAIETL
jgi:rubrerythrin